MNRNIVTQLQLRESTHRRVHMNYEPAFFNLRSSLAATIPDTQETGLTPVRFPTNSTVPIFACHFCPMKNRQNLLAIANENGALCIDDISRRLTTLLYTRPHFNTIFDISWVPNDLKLVTASGDNTCKLLDIGDGECKVMARFRGHTKSVKTIGFKVHDNAVFATGSRDGNVIIWDARSSVQCNSFTADHRPDQIISTYVYHNVSARKKLKMKPATCYSVTGAVFQDENTLITSHSTDGTLLFWDLRWTYTKHGGQPAPKFQLNLSEIGYSSLCINEERTRLFVNCMDSNIYCLSLNTNKPKPIGCFYGHQNLTFYIKSCVSRDTRFLASGSSDNCVYVWNTDGIQLSKEPRAPLFRLRGHDAEVTCVDLCPTGDVKLASCADDGSYRLWEPDTIEEHVGISAGAELLPIRKNTRILKKSYSAPKVIQTVMVRDSCSCQKSDNNKSPRKTKVSPKKKTKRRLLDDLKEMTGIPNDGPNQLPTDNEIKLETGDGFSRLSPIPEFKEEIFCKTETQFSSPTANLPNFAVDGTSPYNHKCTRAKRKFEEMDWLTKLKKVKDSQACENSHVTPERPKKRFKSRSTDKKNKTPTDKLVTTYFKIIAC